MRAPRLTVRDVWGLMLHSVRGEPDGPSVPIMPLRQRTFVQCRAACCPQPNTLTLTLIHAMIVTCWLHTCCVPSAISVFLICSSRLRFVNLLFPV